MKKIRHGFYLISEIALRFCILPRLRARLVSLLGGKIGRNVRIYDSRFINLEDGFSNLQIGNDVHVGNGCLFDLKGKVLIGSYTSISPRVTLISHADPGSAHNTSLLSQYPCESLGVEIGNECWIGACATILSGSKIGDRSVVGAMSLVRGTLVGAYMYAGVPARKKRSLNN